MSSKKSKQEAVDKLQESVNKAARDPKTSDRAKLSSAKAMDEVRKKRGAE